MLRYKSIHHDKEGDLFVILLEKIEWFEFRQVNYTSLQKKKKLNYTSQRMDSFVIPRDIWNPEEQATLGVRTTLYRRKKIIPH